MVKYGEELQEKLQLNQQREDKFQQEIDGAILAYKAKYSPNPVIAQVVR